MNITNQIASTKEKKFHSVLIDNAKVKLIAFYLPQFYPIPENDIWWGRGFTEWLNVVNAKPRFKDHYQPHIPADLGFYDLRLKETRKAQADLAKSYGIDGFCYWHYWFKGKRLLERPFYEVLESGEPDFPFCLAWANENWTRRWDGMDQEILQSQEYGGEDDDRAHFNYLLKALLDPRAIKIDDKPIFLIYRPADIPDVAKTIILWRNMAKDSGMNDLYIIAINSSFEEDVINWIDLGFDGEVIFQPNKKLKEYCNNTSNSLFNSKDYDYTSDMVIKYEEAWRLMAEESSETANKSDLYASVVPSWDNSSRRKCNALILHDSTPYEYQKWLNIEIERIKNRPSDKRIVFLNAWNEWAEGNHLEPDLKYGLAYLEATRNASTGHPELNHETSRTNINNYDNCYLFKTNLYEKQDSAMLYEIKIRNLEKQLNSFYNSNGGRLLLRYYKLRDRLFPEHSYRKIFFVNCFDYFKRLKNIFIQKK
jgi:hypothetical protein